MFLVERQSLLVQVHLLLKARDKVLWASIGMVRHLRLAHLLTDFRHESAMQFAAKLALLEVVAELLLSAGIFAFHVVKNVKERCTRAQALGMLSAIFTTIHLRLTLGGNRLRIRIALASNCCRGYVAVHHTVIAAQMTTPQIWPQSVLCHGAIARVIHFIPGIPIAAIPHIQNAFEETCTRLSGIRRPERVRVMEVVQLLRTHRAFVILAALLAVLVFQEPEHFFNTQRRGVLLCFIDALGDVVLFLLALMVRWDSTPKYTLRRNRRRHRSCIAPKLPR